MADFVFGEQKKKAPGAKKLNMVLGGGGKRNKKKKYETLDLNEHEQVDLSKAFNANNNSN